MIWKIEEKQGENFISCSWNILWRALSRWSIKSLRMHSDASWNTLSHNWNKLIIQTLDNNESTFSFNRIERDLFLSHKRSEWRYRSFMHWKMSSCWGRCRASLYNRWLSEVFLHSQGYEDLLWFSSRWHCMISHLNGVLRENECRIFRWIYLRRVFDRFMFNEREYRGEY